jgi:thiol:disulfide interchange protein DsbC
MKKKAAIGGLILALIVAGLYFRFHYVFMTPERALHGDVNGTVVLETLPTRDAIRHARGDGKWVLVTFEDPFCPYCAVLDKKLSRLENADVYTFLVPFLTPKSMDMARRIWCAPDSATAWSEWMLKRKIPDNEGDCDTSALDRNMQFWGLQRFPGVPILLQAKGPKL